MKSSITNTNTRARYVRCSTTQQNPARQLQKLHPDEKLYIDFASGSIDLIKRPEGKRLLEDVEAGKIDYITVESVDRLGRSTTSVINQLQYFLDKKVTIKVENLGLESITNGKPNEIFTLICTVLANLSQMEKTTLTERRLIGIALAKERGEVYCGRTEGSVESKHAFLAKYPKVIKLIKEHPELSNRNISKLANNVSPHTVKKVKDYLTQ